MKPLFLKAKLRLVKTDDYVSSIDLMRQNADQRMEYEDILHRYAHTT